MRAVRRLASRAESVVPQRCKRCQKITHAAAEEKLATAASCTGRLWKLASVLLAASGFPNAKPSLVRNPASSDSSDEESTRPLGIANTS